MDEIISSINLFLIVIWWRRSRPITKSLGIASNYHFNKLLITSNYHLYESIPNWSRLHCSNMLNYVITYCYNIKNWVIHYDSLSFTNFLGSHLSSKWLFCRHPKKIQLIVNCRSSVQRQCGLKNWAHFEETINW